MAAIFAVFAAFSWSCKDDEDPAPTLTDLRQEQIRYHADSIRITDSLTRINAAGVVNYAITVINGSTSSINPGYGLGREARTKTALEGAVVTISQLGKTQTDTTDESGVVVFTGFFRNAVNVTIRKEGFTSVSYISAVSIDDETENGTMSFVGNLVPIFETTGQNTATIKGRATIETDLTNKERELAPDGTTVYAHIDASGDVFADRFMTRDVENVLTPACACEIMYIGEILQASYTAGAVGSVQGGEYTIVVPAATDGLPIKLEYSEIGADQTLFESSAQFGQRTIVKRTIYNDNSGLGPLATLPPSSSVAVSFESFANPAMAEAVISPTTGEIARINIVDGGSGYVGTPVVEIAGDGTGATATANVSNGQVTSITLNNPGSNYTVATVNIISGNGAAFAVGSLSGSGKIVALNLLTSGEGYTSAPDVTITGGGATTDATAVATVTNGRVTALTVTDGGEGYDGSPVTVTISGGGATVDATAEAVWSGLSVGVIDRISGGSDYNYAPTVTFSEPDLPFGVQATGVAIIDPARGEVTAINVTNPGSGYILPPTITLEAGGGAAAVAHLQGGSVISFNILTEGAEYAYPPTVVIGANVTGGGSGAEGTAILSNGRVIGIEITNGGSGYISAPDVQLVSGTGASAYAHVTDGSITGFTVTDGGHGFTGSPRVIITSADGGGAVATATVENGRITGVTVVEGGSGYLDGNTPGTPVRFSATKGTSLETKPSLTYVNDIYYGTGAHRE